MAKKSRKAKARQPALTPYQAKYLARFGTLPPSSEPVAEANTSSAAATRAPPTPFDPNALLLPVKTRGERLAERAVSAAVALPETKLSTTKKKRLEKYIEKKLKKEERVFYMGKLASSTFKSPLLRSTKTLGAKKETLKQRLKRALLEEQRGLAQSDPTVPLYKASAGTSSSDDESDKDAAPFTAAKQDPTPTASQPTLKDSAPAASGFGSALKRAADGQTVQVIQKRQRRKKEPTFLRVMNRSQRQRIAKALHRDMTDDEAAESDDGEGDTSSLSNDATDTDAESDSDGSADDAMAESESNDEAEPAEVVVPEPTSTSPTIDANAGTDAAIAQPVINVSSPAPTASSPSSKPSLLTAPSSDTQSAQVVATSAAAASFDSTLANTDPVDRKKAFYRLVERIPDVQAARENLPVFGEEQTIMEHIKEHPVIVLCGETGSGKTTQVPQFLYEAGYGHPDSDNPGIVGVTQPRRVAAVSMAQRVQHELNVPDGVVSHQIRYDSTVSAQTAVKFMTDGVLLRELAQDLLLSKYSVIIIDEAHERSLNTDILIGVVSRVVTLRERLAKEGGTTGTITVAAGTVKPLRVIIMSATLRIEDFTANTALFKTPPPVLRVDGRQFPVHVHFNRRTHADYVAEAFKKVCKIHKRLPPGGILVFLSSQNEISQVCRKLRARFPGVKKQARPTRAPNSAIHRSVASTHGDSNDQSDDDGNGSSLTSYAADCAPSDLLADEFDLGDIAESQLGDLASDFDTDSDNEDEEASKVLNGNAAADPSPAGPWHAAADASATEHGQPPPVGPMHVLPLYSLLPTAQQVRVFQDPPEGHRLCVVATNIAETSITIPGIRYVVDAGKVKDRKYDHATGAQSFEVGWVSKASADQRAGRAGRTAPGHCYRLYSSAVYNDYFPLFSDPEILKMPIEGVVLQMKGMSLDNVVNFPFPTPPERTALRRAEQLLVSLDALDPNSLRITDHGKIMAMLPISPRFGRMIILGLQKDCLPYLVAIVAALSVGSPFLDMAHVLDTNAGHPDLDEHDARLATGDSAFSRAPADTNQAFAEKERNKVLTERIRKAMAVFTKRSGGSDAIKLLNAVCAYEYGGGSEEFCEKYFLRPKAMLEIRKLRAQLTRLMQSHLPSIPLAVDPRLAPPSPAQLAAIQQAIVAGLIDQIAIRWDLVYTEPPPPPPGASSNSQWRKPSGKSCRSAAYVTMWANDPVYVHPTSAVYHSTPPDAIAYHELERSMKQLNNPSLALDIDVTEADKEKLKAQGKLWLKGNTAVQLPWLPVLGKAMCTFSKPLQFPIPRYFYSKQLQALSPEQRKQLYRGRAVSLDSSGESVTTGLALDKDVMVATVNVSFGLKSWPIPQVQVQQRRIGTRWVFEKIING
ncbi:putative ATP-dependent RNA helicase DHR1 [Dimargaris xerosporica]|nr:putative ATP-dependent RNA helicase DHR1 [Dimargaris xerosporica]